MLVSEKDIGEEKQKQYQQRQKKSVTSQLGANQYGDCTIFIMYCCCYYYYLLSHLLSI